MRRTLVIVLALLLLISALAGCGGKTEGGASPAPSVEPTSAPTAAPSAKPSSAPTSAPSAEPSAAPTQEPQNIVTTEYASYEVDADGVATDFVQYELPLVANSDEFFTFWMVINSATINSYVSDWSALPVYAELERRTGVNVEYINVPSASASTNFSVMLAGDDLPDLINNAHSYFPQSMEAGVEDDYFANIYDYREYCPNYLYLANNMVDENTRRMVYAREDLIYCMRRLNQTAIIGRGHYVRADLLAKIGKTAEDIVTYDDWHDMLYAFKTQCGIENPLFVGKNGNTSEGIHDGYDIARYAPSASASTVAFQVDGKIRFMYADDNTREFLTMLNQWYNEGLINSDFMSYGGKSLDDMSSGLSAASCDVPGTITTVRDKSDIEGIAVVALPKPQRSAGQTFHTAPNAKYYASSAFEISAKCADLPLLISWCDYWYSKDAFDLINYGIEGESYFLNADGEVRYTDVILHNPDGWGTADCYEYYMTYNKMGYYDNFRELHYDGSEPVYDFYDVWLSNKYDRAYAIPDSFTLTEEQNQEFTDLFADIVTFVDENILSFITGDLPLSDWDSYIESLNAMNYDDAVAIYQAAYDDYMSM